MSNASEQQVIITFWLPANEKEQLEAIAATEERSVSALMRLLVRERLSKKEAA